MNNSTTKIQKAKVGVAGSFFNQLMSNNASIPVVGKGATRMHYSDRSCYEVIEVSADGKSVKLEALEAKWDNTKEGGMGHQNWILEPTNRFCEVVWRNNAWQVKGSAIEFTKEFRKKHEGVNSFAQQLTDEERKAVYNGEVFPSNVVEGITYKKTTYSKMPLLFGEKNYYYDWSF